MKALPSIAFSEFTGSAGDVTARSIGGRTLLNHKAYQSKAKTPSQAVSRNTLSKVSRAYKQLTDSQMKAWGALAQHLKGVSIFGQPARMTAHNAFVCLNANRQLAGMTMLSDAPDYNDNIPAVTYGKLWITEERVLLTGVKNPTNDYRLVVKMSAGQGVGISNAWSKMVVVSPGMIDGWGDAPLTELYNKRIGVMPEVGEKVFVEIYWLDPQTGLTGEALRYVKICITDEEAKEEGLSLRPMLTEENIERFYGTEKMHVEEVGGQGMIYCDSLGTYNQGPSGYSSTLKNIPEEIVYGYAYMLGRNTPDGDYKPQCVRITIDPEAQRYQFDALCCGGRLLGKYNYFGVGLMLDE